MVPSRPAIHPSKTYQVMCAECHQPFRATTASRKSPCDDCRKKLGYQLGRCPSNHRQKAPK